MQIGRTILTIMVTFYLISSFLFVTPVMAQSQADLSISPGDISFSNDQPASGEIISIEVTVHNLGPSAATNIEVDWFVEGVPLPPSKTIATIQPGSSGKASHQWATPLPGEYTIRVQANADQSDPESGNNEAQRNITVGTVVPTIIVEAEPSSDTLQSKQTFWVNGTAEMNGEPINGGDVKVEIIQTGVSNTNTTASDGTFTVEMTAPVEQGIYEIKATVTQQAVNGEEIFNVTVFQPDLKITTFTFDGKEPDQFKAKAGQNVKVKVGFQNIGNGTAKDVVFQLKVDGEVATTKDDLGDFAAGRTYSVTYVWKAKRGSHNFQAALDPDDTIEEMSEANNMEAKAIEVKKSDEPSPSFEIVLFIMAIVVIFITMRNGNGGRRKK